MNNELIVKPKTEVAITSSKKDVLAYYNVPGMLDQIVTKEKSNLLNALSCGSMAADSFNRLAHSKEFIVEIPSGLRELLKSGKATFDKSGKVPGNFTPNIRINGEPGIAGQATIVEGTDPLAVTQSLSNLGLMAMVQSVLEKMDAIEEKVEDVKIGQNNDRIGSVIGSFKAFMDLYPSFSGKAELETAANNAYIEMQKGLAQLHLQIDSDRKKLDGIPSNSWEIFFYTLFHPTLKSRVSEHQCSYNDFTYNLQLYSRLVLLTDVVLHLKGDNEAIRKNHGLMNSYCQDKIDKKFIKDMKYLMQNETQGIDNVLLFNENVKNALDGYKSKNLLIECNSDEVKLLNN